MSPYANGNAAAGLGDFKPITIEIFVSLWLQFINQSVPLLPRRVFILKGSEGPSFCCSGEKTKGGINFASTTCEPEGKELLKKLNDPKQLTHFVDPSWGLLSFIDSVYAGEINVDNIKHFFNFVKKRTPASRFPRGELACYKTGGVCPVVKSKDEYLETYVRQQLRGVVKSNN